MCDFASWKEYKDKIWFIRGSNLAGKDGEKMRDYLKEHYWHDICGHGAIQHYWGIPEGKGINKECTDFSTPDNFPSAIVEAIKAGDFANVGIVPAEILTEEGKILLAKQDPLWSRYSKAREAYDKAWKAYDRAREVYNKARKVFIKAGEACNRAQEAYIKAGEACNRAQEAYIKARKVYSDTKKACMEAQRTHIGWNIVKQAKYRVAAWQ